MFEIFVVDDDQDICDAIQEFLEEAGFGVTHTLDPVAALARLKAGYRPAAMIVDVVMPELSGPEFLRACRRDPELARIPVVVISAIRPTPQELEDVWRFLPKPFEIYALLDALLACFDGATAARPRHRL
jgi:CheY-like chemotaxis protein